VNFALFSEHATGVDLCLFESETAKAESIRIPIKERTNRVWHVYLPDALPGQLYGYRVHGPFAPEEGASTPRLGDPYQEAFAGEFLRDQTFSCRQHPHDSEHDSAAVMPGSVFVESSFSQ
jgi:glycogen operon protein